MVEKCLVREAEKKCQCEWCKQQRAWTEQAIENYCKVEALKIWIEGLIKTGVINDEDKSLL